MDQIISELTAWRFAPSQPLSLDSTINLTPVVHNGKPNPTRVYIAGHVGNSSDPGICGFAIWPPRDHGPTGKLLEIHNADLEVLQLCAIVGGLNEIPDRGRVLLLVPNKHIFEVITLHLGYCESYQMRIRTPRGLKRLRNSVLWQLVSEKLRRLHVVVKLIDHHRKDCYALDQLKLKITNSVKERQARLQREALESIMNGRHTFQTSIPQDAPFQRFNRANFVSHLTSPG